MTLVRTENLYGGYAEKTIIRGISFAIQKGEILGIIGPNGSGKSTLLRLLSHVLIPKAGTVSFEGKNIRDIHLKNFCRKVAFVPQDTFISFSLSVEEIVLMGRIPHLRRLQSETKKDHVIAENALTLTDTLHLRKRPIETLSAGERQRVIIAKALTQEPTLLFLDEPTSHLDIGHQIQTLDLLRKLNQTQHITIAIVLHDLNLASEYCNRVMLLDNGTIFAQGTPSDVLTYQNIETVYKTVVVVKPNPFSGKPSVILVSEENRRQGTS